MPNYNEIYDQKSSDSKNVIVTKKPYRNSVVISTMTSTLGSTKSITKKPEVVKKDVIKKPSKQNSDDWTVYNFLKSIVKLG